MSASSKSRSLVTLVDTHGLSNPNIEGTSHLQNATIVSLKHPSTACEQHFLQVPNPRDSAKMVELMEIQSISPPKGYGSFFVGSRVVSDGALHVATRVDPLFFAVAYMESSLSSSVQHWQPLDQFLHEVPEPVRQAVPTKQWKHVCRINNDFGDETLFKYCPERTLQWLVKKYESALVAIQEEALQVKRRQQETSLRQSGGMGAFHSSFRLADDEQEEEKKEDSTMEGHNNYSTTIGGTNLMTLTSQELARCKEESLQAVGEYLSPSLRTKLAQAMKHSPDVLLTELERRAKKQKQSGGLPGKKRRASWEAQPGQDDADRLLSFTMGDDERTSNELGKTGKLRKQQRPQTVGNKKLTKVSTKGMKSLSCFFGKKK